MPIAAKLSHKLDEVLGSEAAEAMVDWMQRIDTSRSELRELNDLIVARIESRFRESDARFREADAKLDILSARIDATAAAVNARIDVMAETVSARIDARVG